MHTSKGWLVLLLYTFLQYSSCENRMVRDIFKIEGVLNREAEDYIYAMSTLGKSSGVHYLGFLRLVFLGSPAPKRFLENSVVGTNSGRARSALG